jgi:hypothetical protein
MPTRYGWKVTVTRRFPKPVVRRVAHGTNTVNWGRILKTFLDTVGASGVSSVTLRDDAGTGRTGSFKVGVTESGGIIFEGESSYSSFNPVALGVLGRLGTGTTPASRTDYNLETPQGSYFTVGSDYLDGDVVFLTGTASFASPISPTEAGLFIELGNAVSGGGKARYMLDRSVFSPLPAGTLFTVRWDITLE